MCTRISMKTPAEALARQFGAVNVIALEPRYNLAPTDPIPMLRLEGDVRVLETARWGLIPRWAKDVSVGVRMVNARAETIGEKPAFRQAFRQQRCLVLADGFYEWAAATAGGRKQPYYFRRVDARPFPMAGLWSQWRDPAGALLRSATVVTVAAPPPVLEIHDRMPAVLDEADLQRWLDPGLAEPEARAALARAEVAASALFEHYAVDPFVGNVHHEGPRCIEPLRRPGAQGALFDD